MKTYQTVIAALLITILPVSVSPAGAHEKRDHDHETETVWKSGHLHASWFGDRHRVRVDDEGALADGVVVKAGRRSHLKVNEITVKYWDPEHHRPRRLHFYPYQRIQHGDRIRFKFHRPRHVLAVKVSVEGWSGSHHTDRFKIILKKQIHYPPPERIQSGYFYGQCIGGHMCPGYRRDRINQFTIDLERGVYVTRIEFYAHDRIGFTHKAALNVYVDDHLVAQGIDVKKRGQTHIIELDHVYGSHITFAAANPREEAMIQRITVNFSEAWERGGRAHHRDRPHKPRHPNRGRF